MNTQQAHFSKKMNNKGSAIVLVVIAMCFIGILSAMILWLAYMNYFMKIVNKNATNDFYSAEAIVEKVRAGLQDEVAEQASTAYMSILSDYASTGSTGARKAAFNSSLLALVEGNVIKNGSFVPANEVISTDGSHYDPQNLVRHYVHGEYDNVKVVVPAANTVAINKITKDVVNGSLTLHDLEVHYVNNGYDSVVHTDLTITAPDIDFSDATSSDDDLDFALVANHQLKVWGGNVTIDKCNIYACGKDDETSPFADIQKKVDDSILVNGSLLTDNTAGETEEEKYRIVSGKNIQIGATLNVKGSSDAYTGKVDIETPYELWTENISLGGANPVFDLKGTAKVYDDLTVDEKSNNAKVTLGKLVGGNHSGSYYGYGSDASYSKSKYDNSEMADPDADPSAVDSLQNPGDDASAILVNGNNATIDLSGLKNLSLLGRSYIGTRYNENNKALRNKVNIPMSESISLKGNQVAYLVPSECIAVWNTENSHDVWKAKNPMTMEEYQNHIVNQIGQPGFTECDLTVPVGEVETSIASFGDVTYQKIFSNVKGLVYFYVVMNGNNANEYFKTFLNDTANMNTITNYADRYGTQIVKADESAADVNININGNYLTAVKTEGNTAITREDPVSKGTPLDYTAEFRGLVAKLKKGAYSSAVLSKGAYDNIINEEMVKNFVGPNSTVELRDPEGTTTAYGVATTHEFYYPPPDPDLKLIISNGNVVIGGDFNGCIFAKGDIVILGNRKIQNTADNKATIKKILNWEIGSGAKSYGYNFFLNPAAYKEATTTPAPVPGGPTPVPEKKDFTMNDMVYYENWTKNGIDPQ